MRHQHRRCHPCSFSAGASATFAFRVTRLRLRPTEDVQEMMDVQPELVGLDPEYR
jgi:hypothetical protein